MDKYFALKIAVVVSLVGLIFLFTLSKFITIEPVKITDIDERQVGKTVLIKGEITKISSSNRTLIYLDNSSIPFIIFSNVKVDKNTKVLITGRVDEYDDGLQILIDKLEIVK